jgi:hypothetical protein
MLNLFWLLHFPITYLSMDRNELIITNMRLNGVAMLILKWIRKDEDNNIMN